ncbi:NADH dehydrogenase [ubiquinone] 1 alpha subcomplex subunit 10, mitochondrial [Orussus abietinus]|uniref:NADH dehydrogenase [ubiquinone] 1 alpha subcomplex subunit 10, mitochondrial n=1 Tax=Orussus abietinus TaxID=222816 RepID=UPI000625C990|nr:NADH dehydrogenase [ubiquinone] 1 alpha subcomplex subunit 10, mitochondrial [Orussus abietinus]
MALSIGARIKPLYVGALAGLCKVNVSGANVKKIQVALITCKTARVNRPPRPPPFPYKEKKFNRYYQVSDKTLARFDDNSKIVVVEGSIAAGKDKLARYLAEQLEMHYFPPPRWANILINEQGFDRRSLDHLFTNTPVLQTCDEERFCRDPHHVNSNLYQHMYYVMRFSQYIDALTHLFSTGQGVVLQRTPWSDYVFMEAMHKAGYVSNGSLLYYNEVVDNSLFHLMLPHLIIYLDVPAETIKKNIMKRGIPYEVEGKALTMEFLTNIEEKYKHEYLPKMAKSSNVLLYDWSNEGDLEVVIEDIERLSFEVTDRKDTRFKDWDLNHPHEWRELRILYSQAKYFLMQTCLSFRFDVPEMLLEGTLQEKYHVATNQISKLKYTKGYNPELGDNVLFKL